MSCIPLPYIVNILMIAAAILVYSVFPLMGTLLAGALGGGSAGSTDRGEAARFLSAIHGEITKGNFYSMLAVLLYPFIILAFYPLVYARTTRLLALLVLAGTLANYALC